MPHLTLDLILLTGKKAKNYPSLLSYFVTIFVLIFEQAVLTRYDG